MDPVEASAHVQTGPLLGLLPPKPISRKLPRLPPRSPLPELRPGWTLETSIVPAAFPRSYPNATKPPSGTLDDPTRATGSQRLDPKLAWDKLIKNQVEAFNQPVSLDDKEELEKQEQLVLVVNRYRPPAKKGDGRKGLTLVLSHANGFYKEVWEPMLEVLLEDLETSNCLPVEEVIALDCFIQGDSAVLNDEVLGPSFNWVDHGRDILNFLISYLDTPSPSSTSTLSSPARDVDPELFKLDNRTNVPSGAASPLERKYRDRLIVGIGHSLGGGGTAFAATACPSLFSSIIFVDPVLPAPHHPTKSTQPLATGALVRKQRWKSRQEALEGFKKKAFFRAWDERVLEGYCEFGLKETDEGVALKTTARAEALTFADARVVAASRANERLATLPKSLPVHFVFADKDRSVLPEWNIDQIKTQVLHATMSRVEGAGHLVVHENPKLTAKRIAEFLKKTYSISKAKM